MGGESVPPPHLWFSLTNWDWGEGSVIHVLSPTFQGLLIKRTRPLTGYGVLGRILNKFKEYVGKMFKIIIFNNEKINIWHLLLHFSRAFQIYKVLPCGIINEKVIKHFWFFLNTDPTFLTVLQPTLPWCWKSEEVSAFWCKDVFSYLEKTQRSGGGEENHPSPSRDRLKEFQVVF